MLKRLDAAELADFEHAWTRQIAPLRTARLWWQACLASREFKDFKFHHFTAWVVLQGIAVGNLAECFELGRGVPKNWVEAGRLYREAAERGWPSAQCSYARFLENGMGMPANPVLARALYAKAAAQGDATAVEAASRLAAAMGSKS